MTDPSEKLTSLRRQAMALPLQPGVYIMKDAKDAIIYIGKAKALKNRVSQYFGSDTNHTEKVRRMVAHVDHFDYIVTGSEFEALVLECSLIKQHAPKYNILLKDDKGYCYIRVSPPPYSRISEEKQRTEDGARYIGPYMSSFVVKQAVDEVNKLFELSTCRKPLQYKHRSERPCLNHHIGQCCAPCTGNVSPEDYAERVEQAVTYLTQGGTKLVSLLTERMNAAAESLDFEAAARLRDRIRAIERMGEKQKWCAPAFLTKISSLLPAPKKWPALRCFALRAERLLIGNTFSWSWYREKRPPEQNSCGDIIPSGTRCHPAFFWTAKRKTAIFWNNGFPIKPLPGAANIM